VRLIAENWQPQHAYPASRRRSVCRCGKPDPAAAARLSRSWRTFPDHCLSIAASASHQFTRRQKSFFFLHVSLEIGTAAPSSTIISATLPHACDRSWRDQPARSGFSFCGRCWTRSRNKVRQGHERNCADDRITSFFESETAQPCRRRSTPRLEIPNAKVTVADRIERVGPTGGQSPNLSLSLYCRWVDRKGRCQASAARPEAISSSVSVRPAYGSRSRPNISHKPSL